jgi:hypothetical protein
MMREYNRIREDWQKLICDICQRHIGYFMEDWTDGAGVTDIVCFDCSKNGLPKA